MMVDLMRPDTIYVSPPEWAGNVVSMIEYNGTALVACQYGVFRLNGNGEFEPLAFIHEPLVTADPTPIMHDAEGRN